MTQRKCIDCEGHGVKRHIIDNGGRYEKKHCKTCKGTGEESILDQIAAITLLTIEVQRLKSAVSWALGEHGTFPEEPPPMKILGLTNPIRKRYWWRSELRQRAGL